MRLNFVFQKNELFCLKMVHRFSLLISSSLLLDKARLSEFVHTASFLLTMEEEF